MIGELSGVAGQAILIEGYAQDFEGPITAVQFSCDEGATWTTYGIGHADRDANVNWSFAFTPPQQGFYRLLVRAVRADGCATPNPACVTLRVEDALTG